MMEVMIAIFVALWMTVGSIFAYKALTRDSVKNETNGGEV